MEHTPEIAACKWWLESEIAEVQPRRIVARGATAAQSLTGNERAIGISRGTAEDGPGDVPVLITWHPS